MVNSYWMSEEKTVEQSNEQQKRSQQPDRYANERDYSNVLSYSFPQKLQILLNSDKSGTVEWLPDGVAFRIVDKDAFVETVIPRFFKRKCLVLLLCWGVCLMIVCWQRLVWRASSAS